MAQFIPITLVGNNLGERHRYLNSLVEDAYQGKIPFESIQDLPEGSAVDRLFKIDLASRYRHVDYIIKNLQDDDMLYVSRALKGTWLLEPQYCDVINPNNLEDALFPQMTTTAVNKMRHWIHLYLKDGRRCEEFFQYYSSKNLELAFKFLWKCSVDFITNEVMNRLEEITPQRFKLLCEKCPDAVRLYFDTLPNNQALLFKYLTNSRQFHDSLKYLLKVRPDLFFDVTEKYFDRSTFNSSITKYIITNHRARFDKKPELYTARLLDIKTLAKCLNSSEIKYIILKLARAKYLSSWFTYKRVEPLINRLSIEEKKSFKKQIFVDKSFGDEVEEWPYPIPSQPSLCRSEENHVFSMLNNDDFALDLICRRCPTSLKRRKVDAASCVKLMSCSAYGRGGIKRKTLLDLLFDRYRFVSFEKTLFELRKQLTAESSSQNREYMMLVLVSKSGGHAECVETLLNLLVTRHKNEPANVRAAVLRSLVKRAAAWRLQESAWVMFLEFARGLGLDGSEPEAPCWEGLHAVVLRDILLTGKCQPVVFAAFMQQFSTFSEYKLSTLEKRQVLDRLPVLLLAAADSESSQGPAHLMALVRLLDTYRLRADEYPGVMSAIIALCQRDPSASVEILQKLYDSRIGRKRLLRENFAVIQTDASYLNVLRHDAKLLEAVDKFSTLVQKNLCHDGFLQKLAIYFSENEGLAERYLAVLENELNHKPRVDLARSIALLAGSSISIRFQEFDKKPAGSIHRSFGARLRANIHLCRPRFDLDAFGWREAGVKAVANRMLVCRKVSINAYVQRLLSWPRAAKLAFLIASRSGQEAEAFSVIASSKPAVAIKVAFKYLWSHCNDYNPQVWYMLKSLITQADLSNPRFGNIHHYLDEVTLMPTDIEADYCTVIFKALHKTEPSDSLLKCVEKYLPELDESFVVFVVMDFMNKTIIVNELSKTGFVDYKTVIPVRIIAKFLLYCTSEDVQKRRFELVGKPFLSFIETAWKVSDKKIKRNLMMYLNVLINAFKCNKVFFDTSYVSCLPVFEKIVTWMRNVIPIPDHFTTYAKMHLTMLYFKAIRQSIKNEPDIFSDKAKRENEGVEIVGTVFGKYLAHEVMILMENYFESIVIVYAKCITKFFSKFEYDCSRDNLIYSTAKGILEGNSDSKSQLLIIESFLKHEDYCFYKSDMTHKKIVELFEENHCKELKFLINAY